MHDTVWHVHVTMMRVDRHYISNVQSFDATLTLRGNLSKRFSLPYHSISSHIMLIDVEYI